MKAFQNTDIMALAKKAGHSIMEIYNTVELGIELKNDNSPLTRADTASHEILKLGLQQLTPQIPVLSEEEIIPLWESRMNWKRYWLIDPLDGTKEFIKRNGEFTVNIALIEDGRPILGVVWAPALDVGYLGLPQQKIATKYVNNTTHQIAHKMVSRQSPINIVSSRSHSDSDTTLFIDFLKHSFQSIQLKNIGSSLKICLVAEGAADIYPRINPTSEWDTAAAHAVLEAAGGRVFKKDGEELRYNQKESLLNPSFFAVGDPNFAWKEMLLGYYKC